MKSKSNKVKHDIKSDTEAIKTVLSMLKQNQTDPSMQKLIELSIERMDKIQNDFLTMAQVKN